MKGLIQKDIYNLLTQLKTMAFILAIFSISLLSQGNVSFFIPVWMLICIMLINTSMSFDDLAKWDVYSLTMPVTRTEIVVSKYILAFLLAIFGGITAFIASGIASLVFKNIIWQEVFLILGVSFGTGFFCVSVILPLIFKFGTEKARIYLVIIYIIPMALVYIIMFFKRQFSLEISEEQLENIILVISGLSPIFGIICMLLSAQISIGIFKKRDR